MPIQDTVQLLYNAHIHFWKNWDFRIFFVLSLLSLGASIFAFIQARLAKIKAIEAGKTIKIQTVAIELSEMIQRLDNLDIKVSYKSARDLLNDTNRRFRRLTTPFKKDNNFTELIDAINWRLNDTKTLLNKERPADPNKQVKNYVIYYAIETNFSMLSAQIAELIGLFEEKSIKK